MTLVSVPRDLSKLMKIDDVVGTLVLFFQGIFAYSFFLEELILVSNSNTPGCGANRSPEEDISCSRLYGEAAQFYRSGECCCNSNLSFANENNSRCCKYL